MAFLKTASPGSRLSVWKRKMGASELLLQHMNTDCSGHFRQQSCPDGTLRYLLWAAALLTPRPPELIVLNEPETSLHPDLLPALARLIRSAANNTQIITVSHAPQLIQELTAAPVCTRLHLVKEFGETKLEGLSPPFNKPKWNWPAR